MISQLFFQFELEVPYSLHYFSDFFEAEKTKTVFSKAIRFILSHITYDELILDFKKISYSTFRNNFLKFIYLFLVALGLCC